MLHNYKCFAVSSKLYVYDGSSCQVYKFDKNLLDSLKDHKHCNIEIAAVKYLIENNYVKKLSSYERVCDCSNHINISEITLHEKSDINYLLLQKATKKYHLEDCGVTCETEDHNLIIRTDDRYEFIECFLNYLLNHCRYKIEECIDELQNCWGKLKSLSYEEIKNIDISSYETINTILENMSNKRLKHFSCTWGIKKLYIKDGLLYRCKYFSDEYLQSININELPCICSVDENDTCKICYAKYICGGICDFSFDNHKQSCELIKNVIDYVLIKYILDEPHNIVEIQ